MPQATKANPAQVEQHIKRQRDCVKRGKFYMDVPRPVELIVTGAVIVLVLLWSYFA